MKKRLLITGATSGIGLDFLKKNINKNYEFFLIGRNFSKIDSLIKNKKHKSKINIINFDLRNNLNKINFKKIPKFDYVVLSAGIFKQNLIRDFNEKLFDEIIQVNLVQTAKL